MWIMMNDAFVSAVQDPKDPNKLVVRARVRGDLERFFAEDPDFADMRFIEAAGTDYAFRCSVSGASFDLAVARAICKIDYGNFKGSVKEEARHDAYMRCWSAMMALQDHCNPIVYGTRGLKAVGKGISIMLRLGYVPLKPANREPAPPPAFAGKPKPKSPRTPIMRGM